MSGKRVSFWHVTILLVDDWPKNLCRAPHSGISSHPAVGDELHSVCDRHSAVCFDQISFGSEVRRNDETVFSNVNVLVSQIFHSRGGVYLRNSYVSYSRTTSRATSFLNWCNTYKPTLATMSRELDSLKALRQPYQSLPLGCRDVIIVP